MPEPTLPSAARERIDRYLDTIDELRPNLVTGLYVIGSIAYGDFQPAVSDVDFVAVTDEPPGEDDLAALREAHRAVATLGDPQFEGEYVTFGLLRKSPSSAGTKLHFHGGKLAGDGAYSPVEWTALAEDGIIVRGPAPPTIGIATDPAELAVWARNNLNTYWRQWMEAATTPASRTALAALTDWGIAWAVLGIARMHYTLATGRITSKTGGGRFALQTYDDRWRPIITEALRCRSAPLAMPAFTEKARQRRKDCIAFMAEVLRTA